MAEFPRTTFAHIFGDRRNLVEIITVDHQRYRVTAIRDGEMEFVAPIEELGTVVGEHRAWRTWFMSDLSEGAGHQPEQAIDSALASIAKRVSRRLRSLGELAQLSDLVAYDKHDFISWTDRTEALRRAGSIGVPVKLIEGLDLYWSGLNQAVTDDRVYLQTAGESGPSYRFYEQESEPVILADDAPTGHSPDSFVGPVGPTERKPFKWPPERPKAWPRDWPYPPPDDWEPPGGWLLPAPPTGPSVLAHPSSGPSVSPSPPNGFRKGVTIEHHWWGDCYCMESNIVDAVVRALRQTGSDVGLGGAATGTGAAAAGGSELALAAFIGPILAAIGVAAGLYGAALFWWAAKIEKTKLEGQCGLGQTCGVKFCRRPLWPYVEAYCYPPKC